LGGRLINEAEDKKATILKKSLTKVAEDIFGKKKESRQWLQLIDEKSCFFAPVQTKTIQALFSTGENFMG
jgi:hypothetical protein